MRIRPTLPALVLLSALTASMTPSPASPACVDYGKQISWHADVPGVGTTWDIAVVGDVAYVAASNPGFQIFDVSTPQAPVLVGSFPNLGQVLSVDINGNHAFLAVNDSALAAVDISNPANPSLAGVVPMAGVPQAVTVRDGLAVVAVPNEGVLLFAAGDPTTLDLVGSFPVPWALDVDISTTRVFVAAAHQGLRILDASDPAHPVQLSSLDFPDWVVDVEVAGDLVYLALNGGGFAIVDVANPSQPDLLVVVPTGRTDRVHVEGMRAYVGGIRGEVLVFDVSNPESPTRLGKSGTHGFEVTAIASAGPCLYTGLENEGLAIINRTFETSIPALGYAPAVINALNVVVHGGIVAASGGGGVQFFDVSSPAQPVPLGLFQPPGFIAEVAYDGQCVYTMNSSAILTIVDATDPYLPQPISTIDLGSFFSEGRLFVDGSLLWVTQPMPMVLRAIDVSDPAQPAIVGTVALTRAGPMRRVGDVLYVGLQDQGTAAVDVSDPATPTVLATFPSIPADALWVEGNLLYAAYIRSLGIWSVEDPLTPVPLGSVELIRWAGRAMAVDHGFAYVESHGVGAQVVDVSDPLHPRLLGAATFLDGVAGHTLALHEGHLILPGGSRIGVFAPQCATTPLAAPISPREPGLVIAPNPFREATTIRMSGSRSGPVKVDIYDVCGRRIRTLVHETMSAGSRAVSWTGDDDRGDSVASGVFFVRVQMEGKSRTERVVRTR